MKQLFLLIISFLITQTTSAQTKSPNQELLKSNQEAIIKASVTNCAQKYNYNTQMAEWQGCLDEGLKKDSTIAYLWQQKAMPYFKTKKYEVGMTYLDKAVKYDTASWLAYKAFIECIFVRFYKKAITDFEESKKRFGNNYIMDHTYNFYIGLSYLQLNEFAKAETLFEEYVTDLYVNRQRLEHPTALFYYAISKYEQNKWEEAIVQFDKALKVYPNFSDAKYYKAICLTKLNKAENATLLINEAKKDAKSGYTINEDNTVYETYPYQKKWPN